MDELIQQQKSSCVSVKYGTLQAGSLTPQNLFQYWKLTFTAPSLKPAFRPGLVCNLIPSWPQYNILPGDKHWRTLGGKCSIHIHCLAMSCIIFCFKGEHTNTPKKAITVSETNKTSAMSLGSKASKRTLQNKGTKLLQKNLMVYRHVTRTHCPSDPSHIQPNLWEPRYQRVHRHISSPDLTRKYVKIQQPNNQLEVAIVSSYDSCGNLFPIWFQDWLDEYHPGDWL